LLGADNLYINCLLDFTWVTSSHPHDNPTSRISSRAYIESQRSHSDSTSWTWNPKPGLGLPVALGSPILVSLHQFPRIPVRSRGQNDSRREDQLLFLQNGAHTLPEALQQPCGDQISNRQCMSSLLMPKWLCPKTLPLTPREAELVENFPQQQDAQETSLFCDWGLIWGRSPVRDSGHGSGEEGWRRERASLLHPGPGSQGQSPPWVGTSDFLFYNKLLKNNPKTRRWWFMPVILAT
jgi:hypothetical protein